jgi:hypothetical protein
LDITSFKSIWWLSDIASFHSIEWLLDIASFQNIPFDSLKWCNIR